MRIRQRYSEVNADISCNMLDRLRLDNISYGRIENYAGSMIRILAIKDDKPIPKWDRQDIEYIHREIADSEYAGSVKKDMIVALKRLYHYAVHGNIAVKGKGIEYDPAVEWITPGSFQDRFDSIQPKDLLTDREILSLIQAVKEIGGRYVKRNISLVFVMLEGAYRPGELLNIKVGGMEFDDGFVRISTTGKTGPKTLVLVASCQPLREWIDVHPRSDDPDAYVFYQDNADGLMRYWTVDYLVRSARKKAGINKRVWPYLFRHTALTEYSKKLGNIAKIYGNWARGSDMLGHYEHLASSDQEDAVLNMYGIKKEKKSSIFFLPKICPSCKKKNSSEKSHCIHCGAALSRKLIQHMEHERSRRSTGVKKLEKKISKEVDELRKLCKQQHDMIETLLKQKNNT